MIAFVFSLFAAQHDWHLRTNLKSLLWVGAGLVFVLMMLFSSQVVNIKVLQEKEIESSWWGRDTLDCVGDRVIFQDRSFIDIDNNKISFSDIDGSPDDIAVPITKMEGYNIRNYPDRGRLIKEVGDNLYSFNIHAYYRTERTEREKPPFNKDIYEKVYLRSYKHTENSWRPTNELDISDGLTDSAYPQIAMRLIDDTLVAIIDDSFVVVDATNPGELKLIDTKLSMLKMRRPYYQDHEKEFAISLVPAEGIGIENRIKLSIDRNYRFHVVNNIYESSIVDVHDGMFAFFILSYRDVARFDVTRWDKENIYCRFSTSPPFTILEGMTTPPNYNYSTFAKNGKLYSYQNDTLMVFDIRSNRKIRKLGHFVRMDYEIDDIAVAEDGNILLYMHWSQNLSKSHNNQFKRYLCLLENPQ